MDLLFCDQSKEIQSKVRTREARKSKERQLNPNANIKDAALSPHNDPSLDIPFEDYALAFFFQNYVLETPQTRCYNGYLPALYSGAQLGGPLWETILAVGLAGLSRVTQTRPLAVIARLKYCAALSLTNSALRQPGKAIEDETLASILLLGLYEVKICHWRFFFQKICLSTRQGHNMRLSTINKVLGGSHGRLHSCNGITRTKPVHF